MRLATDLSDYKSELMQITIRKKDKEFAGVYVVDFVR